MTPGIRRLMPGVTTRTQAYYGRVLGIMVQDGAGVFAAMSDLLVQAADET